MKIRIFRFYLSPLFFSVLVFVFAFFFSENKALATFEMGHISIDSITPNPATTNITISGRAVGGADITNNCPAQPPSAPALTMFHASKLDTPTYQIDNNTLKGEYALSLVQSGNPTVLVCAHDPSAEKYFKYSFRFSLDIGFLPTGHHTITLYALNGLSSETSFDSANFTKYGGSYIVTGSAGQNGSISPASQTVKSGSTAILTVTPNSDYTASAGGCGGSLSGNTYTTGAITADCTVMASFVKSTSDTPSSTPSSEVEATDIIFSIHVIRHDVCINILNHNICFWWPSLRF